MIYLIKYVFQAKQKISLFNLITEINESKTLTKYIWWECKCKFDGRKCRPTQKWNNDECQCKYKNPKKHRVCEKYYIWNLPTFNGK